jgi:hypothetical protein
MAEMLANSAYTALLNESAKVPFRGGAVVFHLAFELITTMYFWVVFSVLSTSSFYFFFVFRIETSTVFSGFTSRFWVGRSPRSLVRIPVRFIFVWHCFLLCKGIVAGSPVTAEPPTIRVPQPSLQYKNNHTVGTAAFCT